MELPALVADHLDDEPVRDRVSLDGDEVVVTPTRTLVYRSEGLISDEAVSTFPNDVERLAVRGGRKKTVEFSYLDGTRSFRVGRRHAEAVLRAVLSGVLAATGAVEEGESVEATYRFEDMTVVVTDRRALKHVGGAVWDEEFESYPFDDVTGLAIEEGVHAAGIVLRVDGRPQRVKVPAEEARLVHRALEEALCSHLGVDAAELEAGATPDEGGEDARSAFDAPGVEPLVATGDAPEEGPSAVGGGDAPDPSAAGLEIDLTGGADGEESEGAEGGDGASEGDAAGEGAPGDDELAREISALRATVEEHGERLDAQEEVLERLLAELREDSRS